MWRRRSACFCSRVGCATKCRIAHDGLVTGSGRRAGQMLRGEAEKPSRSAHTRIASGNLQGSVRHYYEELRKEVKIFHVGPKHEPKKLTPRIAGVLARISQCNEAARDGNQHGVRFLLSRTFQHSQDTGSGVLHPQAPKNAAFPLSIATPLSRRARCFYSLSARTG